MTYLTLRTRASPGPTHKLGLAHWPAWASRWLGYRSASPSRPPGYIISFSSFFGAFAGLSILQAIFGHADYFFGKKVPPIVASYGATAVLLYGAIESPLAQPRAVIFGHIFSVLLSVSITKIFQLFPSEAGFEEFKWLAASLSVASSIVVMQITGTTHPPAGATALIAAVNPDVRNLGWYFLPVTLISCAVMLAVALLVNNVPRRYPLWWFTAPSPTLPPTPDLKENSGTNLSSV